MNKKIIYAILLLGFLSIMIIPVPSVVANAEEPKTDVISPLLQEKLSGKDVDVLIQTKTKNYKSITSQIESCGGNVKYEYEYTNGIAASIPTDLVLKLRDNENVQKISLDEQRQASSIPTSKSIERLLPSNDGVVMGPVDEEVIKLSSEQVEALAEPDTYWNLNSMGAADVWAATGSMGQGSLTVIIDTGVYADHIMLGRYPYGPVIGGIDVTGDVGTPYEGYDSPYNHWHGTHVAGILAGNAAQIVHETEDFYLSYVKYMGQPESAEPYGYPEGYYIIPFLGMAPFSEIYAIKVFDHYGGGAPESLIIYSIELAINMHLSGEYDVDVISMSLGGGTGFDGRSLEDQVVDYATSVGITVVTSAGNSGPASMTVGSPGCANTAISVGAVSYPANTRFFYDYIYGLGDFFMPDNEPQIAYFSSRGPTSDGRDNPTVTATGVWVFSAYILPSDPGVSYMAWAGGTSMSCPAVSGAVALMNTYSEAFGLGASPYDYKEALVSGADFFEGYDKYDQGAGFINAYNSLVSLDQDPSLGDEHPALKKGYKPWISTPKGMKVKNRGYQSYEYVIDPLNPGQGLDFYIPVTDRTDKITLEITDFATGVDPIGFNGFEIWVQSPMRTTEDFYIDAWVYGDSVIEISDFSTTATGSLYPYEIGDKNLPSGYVRVVVHNEWDSYDWVSGKIKITVEKDRGSFWKRFISNVADEYEFGCFETGDEEGYFPVGYGSNGVKLELNQLRGWYSYPTSDLDMMVQWSDGTNTYLETSGSSFNNPEVVFIYSSEIQDVQVHLSAYETYDRTELWWLKVYYLE